MDGWAKTGAALAGAFGGGGAGTAAAYNRGQESAARVQTLLLKAQESRRQAMEREQFTQKAIDAGIPPELAALASTTFGADYNLQQLGAFMGQRQEQGFRADAVKAALAGDPAMANANLMGVASGPQATQRVDDGILLSNVFDPEGAASLTPVGAARVGASNAQAAASYASAGAHTARANLANVQAAAGGFNPNTGGGAGSYSAPAQGSLLAALGAGAGEDRAIPDVDLQDFALYRQANPQFRNGEEALNAYIVAKKGGPAVIIDPSMPGSMTRRPPAPGSAAGAFSGVGADGVQFVIDDPQAMPSAVVQGIMRGDPAAGPAADPAAPKGPTVPDKITPAFAASALRDARAAVATGRITRDQAVERLRAAGLSNVAGQL